ncbi:MAG TPA: hypothetical protein VFO40_29325 [Chthoniobacterales bacterium]|nr:hypothetical protein [Chthoniobacterales bacterium]
MLSKSAETDFERKAALSGADDRISSRAQDRATALAELTQAYDKLSFFQDQLKQATDEGSNQLPQNVALH